MLIMNYNLKPSLEYITLTKVITSLYNQYDVKKSLPQVCVPSLTPTLQSQWLNMEAIVERKVAELPLPKVLKDKMLCFIRPVRLQIAEWGIYLYKCLTKNVPIPNQCYWTSQGILDEKKMVEVIIRNGSIDIGERYKLACIYCMDNDILKLWEKIPEDSKTSFYSQDGPSHVKQHKLVVFWTYYIKGETEKMKSMIDERTEHRWSPYQYGFELAVDDVNRVSTEYFFKKLTTAEKERRFGFKTMVSLRLGQFLYRACGITKLSISHILCFLLSDLNEEKQIEVFVKAPHFVLSCFLDWPLQVFFMETVNRVWNDLDKKCYRKLLDKIIDNILDDNKDFNYQELFREFWKQSPNDFKKYALGGRHIICILFVLFKLGDINNIKLIFQDLPSDEKKLIIYDDKAENICKLLMDGNQLTLLKYFIKECLPSKENVVNFKECFKKGDIWHVNKYSMRDWHQKFLCALTAISYEFKKKKSQRSDDRNAKKCKIFINDLAHSAE